MKQSTDGITSAPGDVSPLVSATPKSVNLGSVEKIPMGQGRCYVVGGEEIAVFRQRDGRIFAIHNRCPHRQGPLSEGIVGAGKVICPLHAHKFDLSNGAGSEGHECVRTFAVTVEQGNVILSL